MSIEGRVEKNKWDNLKIIGASVLLFSVVVAAGFVFGW